MNNVKTFEQFQGDLNVNVIAESYMLLESTELDAIIEELLSEDLNESEEVSEGLGGIIMRKKRINSLLKKETDFKKREKLKAELRGLSDEELKYKGKVEKLKAALKAVKAKRADAKDDKAKFAIDKKIAKLQNKIDQMTGKEAKAKSRMFKKRSF